MKIFIFILTVHVFSKAAVVIEGPKTRTHPEGSNITLECRTGKEGALRWTDRTMSQLIFYGSNRATGKEKYNNFNVSVAPQYSNMSIFNATLDDEGNFSCEFFDDEVFVFVTIEAAPELRLSVTPKKDSVPSEGDDEGHEFYLNCTAIGARPNVSVQFKIGDDDWQPPSSYEVNNRNMLYDTVALLHYYIPYSITNVNAECRTQGQISIPPVHTRFQLSSPVCTLQIHKANAKCQCRGNPEVHRHKITVGTKEIQAEETSLLSYPSSSVTCFGTSFIGTGTSNTVVFKSGRLGNSLPFIVVIVIIICITIAMIIIIFIYRKKSMRRKSEVDESQGEVSGQLMGEYRLPEDQEKHGEKTIKSRTEGDDETYLHVEFIALKIYLDTYPYDWEIFAIKILGLPMDHVRHISESGSSTEDLIKKVKSAIPSNDLSFIRKVFYDAIPRNKRLCKEIGLKVEKENDRYHFRGICGHPKKEELELVGSDERLIQKLKKFMEFMGPHGRPILKKEYAKNMRGNAREQEVHNLAKKLKEKNLFTVSKVVENYANLIEGEMTLMTKLGNDWEIFGAEVMKIPEEELVAISKEKNTADQLHNLVSVWENLLKSEISATVINELIKEVEELNEKVFCCPEISVEDHINSKKLTSCDNQPTTESDFTKLFGSVDYTGERNDGLSDGDFQSVLQGIAAVVGKIGAFKVLQEYEIENTFQPVDNPGYMLIKVLLNTNELKNDQRSLKNLREKLQNSHLHRATAVLDRAVQKQE